MTDDPADLIVRVNDETHRWHAGLHVAELVARQACAPDAVATAVNGEFVARDARGQRRLQPGDQLTLFQVIVGG